MMKKLMLMAAAAGVVMFVATGCGIFCKDCCGSDKAACAAKADCSKKADCPKTEVAPAK
ncbi:hypothetical protein SDC9_160626 [bioreactor metagenome]|uniref:Lipoprotein n=1 Tax=bioreactor metagenome TaxID=1076179 RepID=A0A645FFX5_9ZZZZ